MSNIGKEVFSLQISTNSPVISEKGFGTVMGLVDGLTFAEEIRYYSSAKEANEDSELNVAAIALCDVAFSMTPTPSVFAIGKTSADSKQKEEFILTGPQADGNYTVTLNATVFTVDGTGITLDAIVTAMVSLVDADPLYDALNPEASKMTVQAVTAGVGFTASALAAGGAWLINDLIPNSGVKNDLTQLLDNDWFHFVLSNQDDVKALAAAEWAQANKRMLWISTPDSTSETSSETDIGKVLKERNYDWVMTTRSKNDDHMETAIAALFSSFDIEETSPEARLQTLPGFIKQKWSSTEQKNLIDKNINFYGDFFGSASYFPGVVASGFDVEFITFIAMLEARILEAQAQLFKSRAKSGKRVKFTDPDFSEIRTVIRGVFLKAVDAENITDNFDVVTPLRAEITGADELAEILEVTFGGQYTGKTREVNFAGSISIDYKGLA